MKRLTYKQAKRLQAGFSLIELMVSVGLFTVVMVASVGTLLSLINANQKAQSLKSVINNLEFSIDSMSRTIRTGRLYYCTDSVPSTLPDTTLDCQNGATSIVLTDDHGHRLAYRFANGRIERRDVNSGAEWIALSAQEVVIENMRFYVTGSTSGDTDTVQPTVTISIRGHVGAKPTTDSSFNVETTVTQRVLDQ
jgi:prepilin-type N-terminal cleavage/methylation domain-containing protein